MSLLMGSMPARVGRVSTMNSKVCLPPVMRSLRRASGFSSPFLPARTPTSMRSLMEAGVSTPLPSA